MERDKINPSEIIKFHKLGHKIILGARLTHRAIFDNGIEDTIEQDEEGTLVYIANLDAPDYTSEWGYGIEVDWENGVIARYNDFFAYNGIYDVEGSCRVDSISDLFYLKERIIPDTKQLNLLKQ